VILARPHMGRRGPNSDFLTTVGRHRPARNPFQNHDGHGNTIATLSRNGTGYAIANEKHCDAWGKVRYDGGTGSSGQILNPDQRYCGNLGHKYDSTSGLVYMRARYDEAETGRFISEDLARHGANWFRFVSNSPCARVDPTRREDMAKFLVANDMQNGMQSACVSAHGGPQIDVLDRRAQKAMKLLGTDRIRLFVEGFVDGLD
jgi:RHS repeat-associated protein